jgi:S-adenosylmethionine:tRNA ribosyltransferase-isomerase
VRAAELDFDLPDELIAQYPAEPREQARLMVVERRSGRISHRHCFDLPELLEPGDVLVRNDTRVIPARLIGHRILTGGNWEGLFLQEASDGTWEILANTRGRPRPGERVVVGSGLELVLEVRGVAGRWFVRPDRRDPGDRELDTLALLERHGQTPLPPYIRKGKAEQGDRQRYQTTYARRPGSVAAPTAGLHLSESLLACLAARGVGWVDLTLHVGIGTFRPIEVEDLADHVMHAEWAELSDRAANALQGHRDRSGRIVAVGTTSARTLETAAAGGRIKPFRGHTHLFIQPGHIFRGLDALVTNFHLPRSSLLVLVSALAGVELIREAYRQAVAQGYRFFSYGDAMLII